MICFSTAQIFKNVHFMRSILIGVMYILQHVDCRYVRVLINELCQYTHFVLIHRSVKYHFRIFYRHLPFHLYVITLGIDAV